MAISTLNLPFIDGTTVIDANRMNSIVNKINELVNYANNSGGGSTPSIVASPAITLSGNSCTITCSTSGATIKYTLDGSTPSASNGSTYSGAITLNSSCTIKAIAIKTGMTNSSVTSKTYTVPVASDVEVDTTDILELRPSLLATEEGVTSNSSYQVYQYCIAGITAPTTINVETTLSASATYAIIYLNSRGEFISSVERVDGVNTYSGNIPAGTAYIRVNCRSNSEASVHIFETSNSATISASEVEVTNLDSLVTITNNTKLTTEGTETASNYNLYTYNLSSISGLSRINLVTKVGTNLTAVIQFLDSSDNIISYISKVSTLYDVLIPSGTKSIRLTCYSPNSETPTVKIYRR